MQVGEIILQTGYLAGDQVQSIFGVLQGFFAIQSGLVASIVR
jgi:hypothetical protein